MLFLKNKNGVANNQDHPIHGMWGGRMTTKLYDSAKK